jgi:hypothetical protein
MQCIVDDIFKKYWYSSILDDNFFQILKSSILDRFWLIYQIYDRDHGIITTL